MRVLFGLMSFFIFFVLNDAFMIWPLLEDINLKRLTWVYYPSLPTVHFLSKCNIARPKTMTD